MERTYQAEREPHDVGVHGGLDWVRQGAPPPRVGRPHQARHPEPVYHPAYKTAR